MPGEGKVKQYETHWVPDTLFFFESEPSLGELVPQRRRWLNGTIAGYLWLLRSAELWSGIASFQLMAWKIMVLSLLQLLIFAIVFIMPPSIALTGHLALYGLAALLGAWGFPISLAATRVVVGIYWFVWGGSFLLLTLLGRWGTKAVYPWLWAVRVVSNAAIMVLNAAVLTALMVESYADPGALADSVGPANLQGAQLHVWLEQAVLCFVLLRGQAFSPKVLCCCGFACSRPLRRRRRAVEHRAGVNRIPLSCNAFAGALACGQPAQCRGARWRSLFGATVVAPAERSRQQSGDHHLTVLHLHPAHAPCRVACRPANCVHRRRTVLNDALRADADALLAGTQRCRSVGRSFMRWLRGLTIVCARLHGVTPAPLAPDNPPRAVVRSHSRRWLLRSRRIICSCPPFWLTF